MYVRKMHMKEAGDGLLVRSAHCLTMDKKSMFMMHANRLRVKYYHRPDDSRQQRGRVDDGSKQRRIGDARQSANRTSSSTR
jgi:hypothetical protein